ncbi:hypothetical protein E0500_005440 [Streptomyces sp. KM273126]|uniref:hypothetical protein n=1 Tax=Streptomyces sp. KM273126 TaxID=2545247 RepID=UPI00103DF357|nr:hypothetical protein [Streptomyces sp. KM273126]MBA2806903.1 hypothetical protein [Streptomyces sp. KM273126]
MTALTWILIAIGLVTVAVCAARVHHLGGHSRDAVIALPATGVLSLPALLAHEAPTAAWGLWGAITIASALTWAVADTMRDLPAQGAGNARRGP